MNALSKTALGALGGIAAAVGSALCCAGPLVAVALGLSGAGLATTFEPWRPYFVGGTVVSPWFTALSRCGVKKRRRANRGRSARRRSPAVG